MDFRKQLFFSLQSATDKENPPPNKPLGTVEPKKPISSLSFGTDDTSSKEKNY